MFTVYCAKCKEEITHYESAVHIINDDGFTHTYCKDCGEEVRKRIEERSREVKGR